MRRKRSEILSVRIPARLLFCLLLAGICAVALFSQKPYAAEAGTAYLATAHAYYTHPVTGAVEDAGNNAGIGQAMTESVLNASALIEKTESATYATVRLSMMDSISNVRFAVQERNASGWTEVSSEVMQENTGDSYTSDFRLQIPSESAIVRIQLYVTPMGRDVIFYADFSDLQEGSGDFIVSVESSGIAAGSETTSAAAAASAAGTSTGTVASSSTAGTASSGAASATTSAGAESSAKAGANGAGTSSTAGSSAALDSSDGSSQNVEENSERTGEQLIASADGLVLSDESLLEDTEAAGASEEESTAAVNETDTVPALSWTLVFQCLILLTVPGIVVGIALLAFQTALHKRERDKE